VRIADGSRARDLTGFPAAVPTGDPRYPWDTPSLRGLNARSQVVGAIRRADSPATAFIWERGAVRYLPTLPDPGPPGVGTTTAFAIDDRSTILGTGTADGGASEHPVLWRDGGRGGVVDLGVLPGARACIPEGHTERFETGYVVGTCFGPGTDVARGFVWHRGTLTDIGNLGRLRASATAVNERGQVVGTSDTAAGAQHAVVWERGVMTDLGTLGGSISSTIDIDEHGRIVGASDLPNGRAHAVLWLPDR
jgi:probable HAF family extracellular repeat protein